ncbi:ABC-type molybdate transport system, periplasmic component [Thermococcus kodakarensis KOD1]|uniref:ABC-type molybdate transport system, periplasmic component n=1 Tax=Thermococcus kodakarensis (strain ATCC BAA-918 / JCM 12380 / KOD1) TaxID=69014 RepID=Q5JG80_THEKO|nr:molybdate ABC transporter substrate-binding protein [Thermococcus kodakarensis]WCN28745.1 molybdate ABC transporter substrate-binding protein [Thermococcus kodakarensis]WCN31042.1 molybdate ABC transporter substrate-binding protein [Thermococcus kodakarensis]BAD84906.1 ABC-type molybdate transport system, periplasmic component [Thermococcus kodakarensis KOD1]
MRGVKILLLVGVLAGILLVAGCIGSENAPGSSEKKPFAGQTVVVCSGAGLMKPMEELIGMFENETGAKVEVHYGGSSEIFGILQTTCGCDVFVPGAWYYTQQAAERGYILNGTVKNVTYHIPVIAVPKGNPKGIHSLEDLAKPGVRVVLGDPKAAAIGKVSRKVLEKNGLWEEVKPNVVTFTPTVNQLLIYIATGQADAAIIWEDMTTWAQSKGKIEVVEIPSEQNIIKTIPTAVTVCAEKDGHLEVAKAFNGFIANHTEIWEKWGFRPWRG